MMTSWHKSADDSHYAIGTPIRIYRCPLRAGEDGLSWVGKLPRLKAALLTFVPPKAAVKVNLPISILYDEVWLCTTVMRSTCEYDFHKIRQAKSAGQP